MIDNTISPSLALIKAGIKTNQPSRRLCGWRKFIYNSVRYTLSIGIIALMIKLLILIVS